MKLFALILLYNKNILDSVTYKCIKDWDVEIIVYDNSTSNYNNQLDCEQLGINYLSQDNNVGLTRAYNFVFKNILEDGYLMLFDDDTSINIDYFDKVQATLSEDSLVDIVVPQVISSHNNKLYSPRITRKRVHAINSGLVISSRIYKDYRYPEELFLYFADLQFFDDNRFSKIVIVDVQITQDFSEFVKELSPRVINQFQLRINDAKVYFRWYKYYPYLLIFVVSKVYWFRSLKLLKLLFKNLRMCD